MYKDIIPSDNIIIDISNIIKVPVEELLESLKKLQNAGLVTV